MISLRPATVDDVATLFEIRCSVRENHQSREELASIGVTPDTVREMIESGDFVSVLAELDGEAIAFSMAQISEGYIFATFVRPGFEGRGVGRAVLEAAEQGLAERGVGEVWLSTGPGESLRAVGFYRHLGWKDSGLLEDGQIRFTKTLRGE